jgi:hypothetical protein
MINGIVRGHDDRAELNGGNWRGDPKGRSTSLSTNRRYQVSRSVKWQSTGQNRVMILGDEASNA